MRVLAIEPYDGGSHAAFLDGWLLRSRHHWMRLGLPPFKWKWRMRHGAITMADRVSAALADGAAWDVVFCSDMLNLAEFRGLASESVRRLPTVAYFHENQLTYPVRDEKERDWHFAFTNITTALAADAVWFNSAYHGDEFLDALPSFLRRMPDHQPLDATDRIRATSRVEHPGIEAFTVGPSRSAGPLQILWAARWEHDKDPETFFAAIQKLVDAGEEFRLSVVGEQFRDAPDVFDMARERFADRIDRWGYQPSRADFVEALLAADVIVSTAQHEFFGLSVVEAIAAGAYPLLPKRLSYPELLRLDEAPENECCFYDGSADDLAHKLAALIKRKPLDASSARDAVERFDWSVRAPALDDALERLVQSTTDKR